MVIKVEGGRFQRSVIVLTEPIAQAGLEVLEDVGEVRLAGTTDPSKLKRHLTHANALVVRSSPVTAAMMDCSPNLQVIGRHGAGIDNIDTEAARQRGVTVVHTPGSNAASVAEFVILAALALSRRLVPAHRALLGGEFFGGGSLPAAVVAQGWAGAMLDKRTVGLIGLGAIGRQVARYADGMGAAVMAYDPGVAQAPPGVTLSALPKILAGADVLSLHVPLTSATRHLIDESALQQARTGLLLVNTSRAGVVDDDAVLAALDDGTLGGYAVDVYDPEPPPADHPLLSHPLVLATPHMAAMTTQALDQMALAVAHGVVDVLAGRTPAHPYRL